MDDLTTLQDELLLAILPDVEFDGWTDRALRRGAEASGHGRAGMLRAFPNGIPDLIGHFADWADRQMLERIAATGENWAAMKVRQRIAFAVQARLEALAPYRESVRRLAGVGLVPSRGLLMARTGWRTVDRMWRAAGDTATDFNHYSKRALLGGVQAATLLVWLNDRSEGSVETWAFLERRIAEVLQIGRRIGGLGRLGPVLEAPWRLAGRLRHGRRAESAS